jgi:2-methylcitrate dehydratase
MPCEGHGISGVEAALIQRGKLLSRKLTVANIAKIRVRVTAAAHLIINKQGPLHNAADRDHCIQYVIALAFIKGAYPEAHDYNDESPYAQSKELEALRARIDIIRDEKLTQDYLDLNIRSVGAGMSVMLHDGSVMDEVLVEFPPGHANNSGTKRLQRAKFRKNMALMFESDEVDGIERAVQDSSLPVSALMDLLARGEGPLSARL